MAARPAALLLCLAAGLRAAAYDAHEYEEEALVDDAAEEDSPLSGATVPSVAGWYEPRSLVRSEGKSVGDFRLRTLEECKWKCDATPGCNSFSFSKKAYRLKNKGCNLKGKIATQGEAASIEHKKGDYKTYRRIAAGLSDEQLQDLLDSGADIQRLHAASMPRAPFAGVMPFRAVCALAAGGVAVALLTLAVLSRTSVRRFGRLPQPSSDASPADEPLVAATVE